MNTHLNREGAGAQIYITPTQPAAAGETRITFDDSGPDSSGRRHYWLLWTSNYHPGDPAGEHRTAERGQIFLSIPPKAMDKEIKHVR